MAFFLLLLICFQIPDVFFYDACPMDGATVAEWTYSRVINGAKADCGPASLIQLQDLLDE